MAEVGNISKIEMNYMNSIISLSKIYRNNSKLVQIYNVLSKTTIFVPKNKILSISSDGVNNYYIKTKSGIIQVDKEQFDKLIKEW